MAPSTRRTYSTGEQRYLAYCQLCCWEPFPTTDYKLSCFCAYLATSVRPCTIAVYVQAVRNAQLEYGLEDPTKESWLLKRILKGIQHYHGTETIKPRLSITMPILRKLVDACRHSTSLARYDSLLYQSALLLVFFGFLRSAEFTSHLSRNCVKLDCGSISLFLRRSKTDPLGRGVYVDIGPASPAYCPVQALLAYLAASRHLKPVDPLCVLSSGRQLTRPALTETVRLLLRTALVPNAEAYSGISFRIGAATTAAVAGVPDSLIRAAGRWKSHVALRYMRLSVHTKQQLSSQLSSINEMSQ